MRIYLDELGHISAECPAVFWCVEEWMTGRYVADFSTEAEAAAFAIADAKSKGARFDHKVSRITLARA